MLLFATRSKLVQAVEDITDREGVLVKIPMDETHVRSLNLATSVGIGLFEVCSCPHALMQVHVG